MYRFLLRPRWILFTAVVAGAILAMLQLSMWQLRRLDERQAFNSTVSARLTTAPVPLTDPSSLTLDDEWTNVVVSGTYDDTEQLEPAAGMYRVIGRLGLAGGGTVLVERGTLPTTAEDAADPPSGTVQVVGRIRRAPSDIGVLAPVDGGPVMLVQAATSDPADDPSLTPSPAPDTSDEGPHLSYAVQWLIFAVCVAVGWVLAVRRSARTRRAAEAGGTEGTDPAGTTASAHRRKHQAVPWRE